MRKKPIIRIRTLLTLFMIISLLSSFIGYGVAMADDATITTDKTKYSLGEPVTILGSGFATSTEITITVERVAQGEIDTRTTNSEADGSFSYIYVPPEPYVPGRYNIEATDGMGHDATAITWADPPFGVTKSADPETYTEGTIINYTYTVHAGHGAKTNVTVEDDMLGTIFSGISLPIKVPTPAPQLIRQQRRM